MAAEAAQSEVELPATPLNLLRSSSLPMLAVWRHFRAWTRPASSLLLHFTAGAPCTPPLVAQSVPVTQPPVVGSAPVTAVGVVPDTARNVSLESAPPHAAPLRTAPPPQGARRHPIRVAILLVAVPPRRIALLIAAAVAVGGDVMVLAEVA
ncbi:unnamed protein product [Closterium sp. Naga37s-1]|nr:unnamed protein product [Closterium sp. Naga37s-1]